MSQSLTRLRPIDQVGHERTHPPLYVGIGGNSALCGKSTIAKQLKRELEATFLVAECETALPLTTLLEIIYANRELLRDQYKIQSNCQSLLLGWLTGLIGSELTDQLRSQIASFQTWLEPVLPNLIRELESGLRKDKERSREMFFTPAAKQLIASFEPACLPSIAAIKVLRGLRYPEVCLITGIRTAEDCVYIVNCCRGLLVRVEAKQEVLCERHGLCNSKKTVTPDHSWDEQLPNHLNFMVIPNNYKASSTASEREADLATTRRAIDCIVQQIITLHRPT